LNTKFPWAQGGRNLHLEPEWGRSVRNRIGSYSNIGKDRSRLNQHLDLTTPSARGGVSWKSWEPLAKNGTETTRKGRQMDVMNVKRKRKEKREILPLRTWGCGRYWGRGTAQVIISHHAVKGGNKPGGQRKFTSWGKCSNSKGGSKNGCTCNLKDKKIPLLCHGSPEGNCWGEGKRTIRLG